MNKAQGSLLFLIIIIGFCIIYLFSGLISVEAQVPYVRGTTANVTVGGFVDVLNVTCYPINYTTGSVGRKPATKVDKGDGYYHDGTYCGDDTDYIWVWAERRTNVKWDLYIKATDMIGTTRGDRIPVDRLSVNSTCPDSDSGPVSEVSLSDVVFIPLCSGIKRHAWVNISFYLTIPAGQYNDTYFGNITLLANSTDGQNTTAEPPYYYQRYWNATTSLGDSVDITTVMIGKYIEILWNDETVPITFATLSPGTEAAEAVVGAGWPANVSNGFSNVPIDLYINGTNLYNITPFAVEPPPGETVIGSHNISYANATPYGTEAWHWLNLTRPPTSTKGDFPEEWPVGWYLIPNDTEIPNWWNISVPSEMEPGDYGGNVTAKAVDAGEAPGWEWVW